MASRRSRDIKLPPPYLLRVWLDAAAVPDRSAYPFCLPFLHDGFEFEFDTPVTIIVGENGVGKSTLIEGIAALVGFDDAGGAKGHRPVDHSGALETSGNALAAALKAAWRPKLGGGWFFKAETFFTVARYLDDAAMSSGGAAIAERPLSCPHVALVPRWDRLDDMGKEDRVSGYDCEGCGAHFTPDEATTLRATEASRLAEVRSSGPAEE